MEELLLIPFFTILIVLSIEDFKNLTIDIRWCIALFLASLIYFFVSDISIKSYIINISAGFFVMIFLYVFSLKIYKLDINIPTIQYNNKTNSIVYILGFIPSLTLGLIIFWFCKNTLFIKEIEYNSQLFLNELYIYVICIVAVFIVVKLMYVYFFKKKNRCIFSGLGDGDVIVLTIVSSLMDISSFLIVVFISLIVHLFSYVGIFFIRKLR